VHLLGANLGGDLDCRGGTFNSPGEMALAANGLNAGGNVFLDDGFSADGLVVLNGASVKGQLVLQPLKQEKGEGFGLSLVHTTPSQLP
jgi:hypothetical protein